MKSVVNKTEWDIPALSRPEGYLHVDHRNSPGLPEHVARKFGYVPELVREGQVYEAKTKACCHCPSIVVLNPERRNERGFCPKCSDFICDACVIASRDPSYVHRTRQELIDLVRSGKWIWSGSMSLPTLTRKEASDG